jgi:predicted dehydrogenase
VTEPVTEPLRIVVVGCGYISGPYGRTMSGYQELEIVGATDVDTSLAAGFAECFGGVAYPSLGDVLADPAVDAIVNLTSHGVHAEITTAALRAGKHVHSEKPMASSYEEARALVEMAEANGVRLSSSPITFMGDAQETAWRLLASGAIGTVRVAYAEVNWGRIETWHPRPEPFYSVGPLVDVGIYPLTILTAIFGPARRVSAFAATLLPDRLTLEGAPFSSAAPDYGVASIELASGVVARLTTTFYVAQHSKQSGIEFHGDEGSLHLSSWQDFDAAVELAPYRGEYEAVAIPSPFAGIDWGKAVAELAAAVAGTAPQRATGAHAAHVIEILDAIATSAAEGRQVSLCSTFEPPAVPLRQSLDPAA